MHKHIRKKNIKINGKSCKASTKLLFGQELSLYLADDLLLLRDKRIRALEISKKLNIVYEDKNIILVDKDPGIVCQPDKNNLSDSLIDRIKCYLYLKKEYIPEEEKSFSPSLINRIDRNTSGLVLAAKNAKALRVACEKMRDREIRKFYICVVEGHLAKKKDEISNYIKKNKKNNKVRVFNNNVEDSKYAVTKYQVLSENNGNSLIKVEILSGRSHQIRSQFANIGHPLLADHKYGSHSAGFFCPALRSYKLKFCFKNSAGVLDYLSERQFKISIDRFLEKFF
jgi:23S rRNA pseudouridine955/2504/2580 synthase